MSAARVINYGPELVTNLPFSGKGAAAVIDSLVKRGATPGTDQGFLIPFEGTTNANPDAFGILKEAHATADDTDQGGTIFTKRKIELINLFRCIRMEYSLVAADRITVTQAVTTTTITLTSLENDIDGAWFYVVAGTGAGQLMFLTASAAGSATLKAAFGTSLDTTSRLIKILPRFHQLACLSSDGTKLSSTAAAGGTAVMVLDQYIIDNSAERQLNPVNDSGLTGLDGRAALRFEADVLIRNAIPYSID